MSVTERQTQRRSELQKGMDTVTVTVTERVAEGHRKREKEIGRKRED